MFIFFIIIIIQIFSLDYNTKQNQIQIAKEQQIKTLLQQYITIQQQQQYNNNNNNNNNNNITTIIKTIITTIQQQQQQQYNNNSNNNKNKNIQQQQQQQQQYNQCQFHIKYCMQVFLIIISIITSVIFLIINLYITVIYKHKQQSIFIIKNILCLILIIITLLQIQFQPLFMLIDIINSRSSSTNLTLFWIILYFSILVNLAVLKPLMTSIYEQDEDDPLWKRILWVIVQVVISVAVFGILLGVGWILFGYINLQYMQITINNINQSINTNISHQFLQINNIFLSKTIQFQLTIPSFLLALLCLLGYPILICCGSCGLTALPLTLITQFKNRPKFRRTSQAKQIVSSLKQQTVQLITQSDQLKRAMTRIEFVDGWWARRNKKAEIEKALKQIQNKFEFHKDYYQLFRLQLKMENVNPLVFIGKLILGIFCIILSIMLWIQILLAQLVYKDKGSVFLDSFFILMQENNANFVSVAILMLICVFLSISIIKGNPYILITSYDIGTMFVSNNIPFITIHPIIQGKTWLNSFLFQLSLCVLSSSSLVHLLLGTLIFMVIIIGTFPYYLRGGQISLMMGILLQHMTFLKFFINNHIFIYSYLIMSILGGVFVLIKSLCFTQNKTELLKSIEQKRKKLFGKDNKDKPLHMIEMTEMNLKEKNKQIEQAKERNKEKKKKDKKDKVKLTTY